MTIATCPGPDVLSDFLLGRLPPKACEEIAVHVEGCAGCVSRLRSLPGGDTMVDALRYQTGCEEDLDGGLIQRLIELGQAMRSSGTSAAQAGSGAIEAALPTADAPVATPRPDATAGGSGDARGTENLFAMLAPPGGPDEVGRLGAYRVLEVLGAGGMGIVFRAHDPHLNRLVALKVMRPAVAAKAAARQRFLREARATAAIEHDHVLHVNHVGEEGGVPYLVTPLLRGEPLDQRLRRVNALPVAEVLRIGREIAEGLQAAHARGLIHRDVKPGNVWIEEGSGRVKVLDFGLVRVADDDTHVTAGGTMLGTPAFVAPEQALGREVDTRADLFSLGCVLYRMCTGQLPFKGENTMATLSTLLTRPPRPPAEIAPHLPQGLCALIMRLLAKEREDRPASAAEVVEALRGLEKAQAAAAQEDTRTMPSTPAVAASERPRRRRLLPAVIAALLLLGVGVSLGAWAIWRIRTDDGELVVETNDADLSFGVDKGVTTLKDKKTGREYTVKAVRQEKGGEHVVEVTDVGGDAVFLAKVFVIKRHDGKEVARVRFIPKKPQGEGLSAEQLAWIEKTAKLPPADQVKEVLAKLKEINPGFADKGFVAKTEQGNVIGLVLKSAKLKDLWPVLALKDMDTLTIDGEDRDKSLLANLPPLGGSKKLTKLTCWNTQVSDLSPLNGLNLTILDCGYTKVADLSPLKGMKLTTLACSFTKVADLEPLKGMPLEHLDCASTWVSDVAPLKGMKLRSLRLRAQVKGLSPLAGMTSLRVLDLLSAPVSDLSPLKGLELTDLTLQGCREVAELSPLKGMKTLRQLDLRKTKVADLSPLKGLELTYLWCAQTRVSDLSPLRDMPLMWLECSATRVSDLAPLRGMKLTILLCDKTEVTDLSPLEGMPLETLEFAPELTQPHADLLRSLRKTLKTINGKPAADFLKELDAKKAEKL